MKNKGDLRTWWYWQLWKEDGKWGPFAMQAEGVRHELQRRNDLYKMVGVWLGILAVVGGGLTAIGKWIFSN